MEYVWKKIIAAGGLVFFALCCYLVIDGQKRIGLPGIGQMLLGVAGILLSLWLYNRKNR